MAELHDAVAISDRVRFPEHLHRFAVVSIFGAGLRDRYRWAILAARATLPRRRAHPVLNVLVRDDGRAFARIGELAREERARQLGILADCADSCVASGMIGMKAGIDDELDRLIAEFADRRDDLVGEFACCRYPPPAGLRRPI